MLGLMDEVEVYALDAMSTGVVLAWATEAIEKGLIPASQTDGLKFSWGDAKGYQQAVRKIVEQPTEFYQALAKGVSYAARQYGGEDFALAWGGNEIPGYHTGPVAHIGCLVGARHSHLDNAGYSLDQKNLAAQKDTIPEETAQALWKEESWRQILSSLVVCFFARNIYTPQRIQQILQVSDIDFDSEVALRNLGARILAEKYKFKLREGFSLQDISVPARILNTPAALGRTVSADTIQAAAKYFLELVCQQ
jgi:aldehyde:ferredoxin oxidoreductase